MAAIQTIQSGAPLLFDIQMDAVIETTDIINVVLSTWRLGRHLHGTDESEADFAITRKDEKSFTVSVSGVKCRLLAEGYVNAQVTIKTADGATKAKSVEVVAQIGTYYEGRSFKVADQ